MVIQVEIVGNRALSYMAIAARNAHLQANETGRGRVTTCVLTTLMHEQRLRGAIRSVTIATLVPAIATSGALAIADLRHDRRIV